jgi:hypothetical protein
MSNTGNLTTAAGQPATFAGRSLQLAAGLAGPASTSRSARPFLTAERARELFAYDPSTGVLSRGGSPLTARNNYGYVVCRADGRFYVVHRVIWLLVHGRWPTVQLDHIDGDGANNRLDNLREATVGENQQNLTVNKSGGSSRFRGVCWIKREKRWRASIKVAGRLQHLGRFTCELAARDAYLAAKARVHEFNPVPRDAHTNDGANQ